MISVLCVDDETVLLDVTRVFLERTGEFSVVTSTSAQEAIALLADHSYDAIVSDYQMPEMDGLALLKHIRAEKNAVPFILFTGKGREEVAIEALNSGADFYLQKGGEPKSQYAELANKIRQAVQRREAEKALVQSEEKFRDLVENINDIIFVTDKNGSISYISPRISIFGYTPDEVAGKTLADFVPADDKARAKEDFQKCGNRQTCLFELPFLDKEGKSHVVRTSSRPVFLGTEFLGIRGVMTDITSVRIAEAKITASEERYRSVFEAAADALLVIDKESGKILDANNAATTLFQYARDELQGMDPAGLFTGTGAGQDGSGTKIFGPHLRYCQNSEGRTFPADVLTREYPRKNRTIIILSIREITREILAEERELAAQRLYAVLSRINQAIIRVRDLENLINEICRATVEAGGFAMAWIGLLDQDSFLLRPIAHAGHEDGYLDATDKYGNDDERRESPIGIALHEGRHAFCNDIETDPCMAPWRTEALKRGYRSSAAFPFRLHGRVIGVYCIYAGQTDFFTATEIALFLEIAGDISFALDALDEQERRAHAEKALAGSEERAGFLAGVLETSQQAFGVAYPGGAFGIVNPALCTLLGYTEAELRSMRWTDVTHPDSREPEAAMLAELTRTGMPVRYEKNYIRKDGSTVPVEAFVHRVTDDDGNIRYFYGFITDITERKQMEELLQIERDRAQQYLDTAGLMLAALDKDGTITLMNRRGSAILGWPDGELIGKNWMVTCLPERIRDDVKNILDAILRGDRDIAEYHENAVLTKDGEERVLAFHNTAIRNKDGAVTGVLFSGEDITLRCQAEKDLQKSEERFRNLIQNASDMIRIIGQDGLIAYSSPSTFRITGYRPSEVMGKNPLDFIHPDDRKAVTSALAEVIDRTNPGEPTEYRIRHADGTYIDVEAVATNLFDVAGINGIVTTARPITERKQAEQALLESEGRYRAIFEQSPDAMIVLSDHVIDCNPRAERLFGFSRAELINSRVKTLCPEQQPGGRESAEMIAASLQAARDGRTQIFPFVFCTSQHREFPAEVSLIPARIRGKDRIIAIIHDLSEQEKTKEQIQNLARFPEHSPHPVIEMTEGKDITWANPASFDILQKAGMPADPAAFIPADLPPFPSSPGTETVPVRREVQVGPARYRETLVYDPDDRRVRIYAHEVTNQDMVTGALAQANRKLSRLASITRHDIKNKLTGVMGYLELAKGSTKDPDMIEYLTRAETSATAVRQQIEFTKEYDQLGMNPPAWQEISPLLAAVRAQLGESAVAVRDETADLAIFADPLLEKVLYCLLENAQTHGGNVSAVHIHGDVVPDGYLLVVEDDGAGIPEDRKEKIFTKNVGKGGGGFGLFLAREVLSITGITITETGKPEEGARFEIFVPAGKFRVQAIQ